jgi:hypothetical protein
MPASTGLAGLKWGGFYSNISINHGGTVVFSGSSLTDADVSSGPSITSNVNDGGIFTIAPDGTMGTVVRTGPATYSDPGAVPVNMTLQPGEFVRYNSFSSVAINSLGQVAFSAQIVSNLGSSLGSLTPAMRQGLFLTDLSGGINLIAQSGTSFEVAPGDVRTISTGGIALNSSGGEDGRSISLNDNGDLVFYLSFDANTTNSNLNDDVATSGVFIAHVPAPGSAALLGLGGLVATRRRRR